MEKKHIKILMIEDNPGDARLIEESLAEAKDTVFEILCEDQLSKGLDRLGRESVDLIFLDLSLPDSRGLDTFLKVEAKAHGIPVVVLTGLYDEAVAIKAVHEGAQDYLVKGQVDTNLLFRSIFYAIERQRIEEELRRSNDLNQSILKALPFGMEIVDESGDIVYLSERFESIFGRQAIGKKCWLVYRDDKTQCYDCALKSEIKIGEVKSIETEGLIGGKIFQIMHIGIMYQGKKSVLEIFNDITERKRIEQMKSDFVALVSHQLKTPVGELNGYIDNMLSGLTGELIPKQKQYLSEMKEINARAYRLISDLLNVSRIERGIISVNIQQVRLSEIVDAAVKDYRRDIIKKGLALDIEEKKGDINVLADKDKMVEAMSNVINNALRYTEKGTITIRARSESGFGYVDIEDTGRGVAPELLNKLFTKEQTLSGCPVPDAGAGLGLYITKSFMQLQNGDVSVESVVGKGSKFIFKIPLVMV